MVCYISLNVEQQKQEAPVFLVRVMAVMALSTFTQGAWAQGELYFNPGRSLIWDFKAEKQKEEEKEKAKALEAERANETPYIPIRQIFSYLAQNLSMKMTAEDFDQGALQGLAKRTDSERTDGVVTYNYRHGDKRVFGRAIFSKSMSGKKTDTIMRVFSSFEDRKNDCLKFGEAKQVLISQGWRRDVANNYVNEISDSYQKSDVKLSIKNHEDLMGSVIHSFDGHLDAGAMVAYNLELNRAREAIAVDSDQFKALCVEAIWVDYVMDEVN
ncbi:hypothetical protein [Asticcacaulis endophyticus]|uniref:Uncharacterized protein n=1 Tax=Asticcacaulis endophyticus TaxID=1395890 RepID=A0A918PR97_9CAUL|nr:hypothetical protein [Asticcacaulis endophyticus]GGZ20406.1 hypothetical protein GCM10011273_01240 [Asticcacaulis endophyticus]